jgi:hypothetical protein
MKVERYYKQHGHAIESIVSTIVQTAISAYSEHSALAAASCRGVVLLLVR